MSFDMTVRVHSIAEDGLPSRDQTNVAFIFDGCIVSGWPLRGGPDYDEGSYSGYWEADSDVGRIVKFANVTHWVEFPTPLIKVGMIDFRGVVGESGADQRQSTAIDGN